MWRALTDHREFGECFVEQQRHFMNRRADSPRGIRSARHRSKWKIGIAKLEGNVFERQAKLFEKQPHLVETVLAGGRPDDVDTPEDYDKIIRLFPRQDSR